MDLPQRKNIRLKDYDYSQNGAYFITICIKDRHELLWDNAHVGANCVRPILSEIGNIIDREIQSIPNIYADVKIDKHVIMPNHIHMIIVLSATSGRTQFAPTISRIIKQFKGSITKQIVFNIWHYLFHDHIIRNDEEYQKIWQYIEDNPITWKEDCYYK